MHCALIRTNTVHVCKGNVFVVLSAQWEPLSKKLASDGHKLVAVSQNLIDLIWDDQPESPTDLVIVQPLNYSGQRITTPLKCFNLQYDSIHCKYCFVCLGLQFIRFFLAVIFSASRSELGGES